ncbi:outer membrane lipoprotein carrier protein LolA [Bdellovibrio sp. SKB1291214]|uniref:LolA family protein n=1 Tax=Bdellovibrio sp. SKB1291214 TaxID=1732569 RepID=UPI001595A1F6|nr:outer membrane lipoprotein carrier protein LolA [Bdellovibrio sp. SKB1291214]UYL09604.1 outer membrane lipoprotein carrier protein LolA [Bdellovibrio sp. SKB1291214]
MRVHRQFLIFLVFFVVAQSALAALQGEAPSKDMKLAEFKKLTGQFKQSKILKELDVEIKTEGRFQVLRPTPEKSVFHWNITKPKPSNICIDGVGIVVDSGMPPQRKNLKFSEVGKEAGDQIASLLKIITMNQNRITEEFVVQKQGAQYLLTPKNLEKAFFETATLDINKDGLVKNVLIKEKSKDEIRIEFLDMKTQVAAVLKDEKCDR